MKRLAAKIRELESRMKLKQRMFVVYALGCLLPLIFVYFYIFNSTSRDLTTQQVENQMERLETQKDELLSAMDLAQELSTRFYFDSEENKLALIRSVGEDALKCDYRDFDLLSDYLAIYYRDISRVNVYLYEGTMKVDNMHFKLITDTIMEKNWYQRTTAIGGKSRWSYLTNVQTGLRSLRLTRTLYSENGQRTGVISISIDPEISGRYIRENDSSYSIMLLNDDEVVYDNSKMTEEEISYILGETGRDDYSGDLVFRNEHCVTSRIVVQPRYTDDYYSIIIMTPNPEISNYTRASARRLLMPLIFAVIITAFSILALNGWFSRRIYALNRAMKSVTEKKYEVSEAEIGSERDEIWELYNDLNKMVIDMQALDKEVAEERLQREQLYSRQKDVEFKMLTTQINPHFLYNTLENIRMLAAINNEKEIEEISVDLTRLLRNSLEAGQELKTLAWEMDMVESYIRIQDFRFGDRIKARVAYDKGNAANYMVIPFAVQPFIENAYVHGMEDMESGNIDITVETGSIIRILIQDDGRGMNPVELAEVSENLNDFENLDRTHIGICNVNQRIKLRFGDEYGVSIESGHGIGTRVEITMPVIRSSAD